MSAGAAIAAGSRGRGAALADPWRCGIIPCPDQGRAAPAALPAGQVSAQPFTAPLVRPAMNSFWSIRNRISTGAIDTRVPAISMPYSVL